MHHYTLSKLYHLYCVLCTVIHKNIMNLILIPNCSIMPQAVHSRSRAFIFEKSKIQKCLFIKLNKKYILKTRNF